MSTLPDFLTSAVGDSDSRGNVLDERSVQVPHTLPFGARRPNLVREVADILHRDAIEDEAMRYDDTLRTEALNADYLKGIDSGYTGANPQPYIQNPSPYASHLIPPRAFLAISKCLAQGEPTHGRENWRKGDIETHIGRGLTHAALALAGDGEGFEGRVEELTHLACRAMFALELALEGAALRQDAIAGEMQGRGSTDGANAARSGAQRLADDVARYRDTARF